MMHSLVVWQEEKQGDTGVMMAEDRTERNAEIFHAMVVYGFTLKEVAERYGLSLERVGQIVLLEAKRMGIVGEEETSRSIRMIRRAYFRHIGNGLMVML